jgi:uroporphyrinogen-III synthase
MPGSALTGRVVLVTRPASQSEGLLEALRSRGASPVAAPTVRIEPAPARALDAALDDLARGRFDWLVVTSRSGVEALVARLRALARPPSSVKASVAAVGEGTAEALRVAGLDPALIPPRFTTEALAEALPPGPGRILLARADIAPPDLEQTLQEKGWETERVEAYRTRLAEELPEEATRALAAGTVDAVTFTSASTVLGFVRAAGPAFAGAGRPRPLVVCIGPVTAGRARASGLPVDAEADPHTIEGLIAALESVLGRARKESNPR